MDSKRPTRGSLYHNAIGLSNTEENGVAYGFKAAQIHDEDIPNTDCTAVNNGSVAITPLSCWPVNHPLGMSKIYLRKPLNQEITDTILVR